MRSLPVLLFLATSLFAQQVYVSPFQGDQLTFSTVNGPAGSPTWSASEGSISQAGVFLAPQVSQPTLVTVTATWAPGVSASVTVLVRGEIPPEPGEPGTIVIDVQSGATLVLSDGSTWTAPVVTAIQIVPIGNTGISARVLPGNQPPPPPPPPPVEFDCATLDLNNAVVVAPFSQVNTAAAMVAANGSCEHPYRMEHLFGRVSSTLGLLKPGMTVWFLPGIYDFSQHIDWHHSNFGDMSVPPGTGKLFWVRNGSSDPAKPAIARCAVPRSQAIDACIFDHILSIHNEQKGQYTTWMDFTFENVSGQPRFSPQTGSFPTDINHRAGFELTGPGESFAAPGVSLVNSTIKNTAYGMASWQSTDNREWYGNYVYNNGWAGPDRAHGPGIYTQNNCSGGNKTYQWNMIFRNARHGFQAFGSGAAEVACMNIVNNVVLDNDGGRQIIMPGAAKASNNTFSNNWIVGKAVSEIGDHDLLHDMANSTIKGNLWMRTDLLYPEPGQTSWQAVNFNRIVGDVSGNNIVGGFTFKSMGEQAENVLTKPPDKVTMEVNKYDPNTIHIVVENGSKKASLPITLPSVAHDRSWRAYDVECFDCGPVAMGNGRTLNLPLNQTDIEPWEGTGINQINFTLNPGLLFKHSPIDFGVYVVYLDK